MVIHSLFLIIILLILQLINVILDVQLMNEQFGAAVLEQLQLHGIKYEVENQLQPNCIKFWRTKIVITETQPRKVLVILF